ncbi:MAG: methyltransferase domain-containing protein [Deltaproteobacteria bacterium]|nr:methyltransferase domain-containing protein [Deltaproteobacteria bacterium]
MSAACASSLPADLLDRAREFVAENLGLWFPSERTAELERGLSGFARERGEAGAAVAVRAMLAQAPSRAVLAALAGHLTIGETYFFREPAALDALASVVVPELIARRRASGRVLRLWSAACCTGEEAYSLAILLRRLLPDLDDWSVTILATDVNPGFLSRAAEATYRPWSFRAMPEGVGGAWFVERAQGERTVRDDVRRMVSFGELNLAEDAYPALVNDTNAMDVILCRNVLMYFAPERAARVIERLRRCLVPGGWLVVGAAETSMADFAGFGRVGFEGATIFRRDDGEELAVPAPRPAGRDLPAGEPRGREYDRSPIGDQGWTQDAPPHPSCGLQPAAAFAPETAPEARGSVAGAGTPDPDHAGAEEAASPASRVRELANAGRLEEALELCGSALERARLDGELHYLRAMILTERGAVAEAGEALRRTLYADPDFAPAHVALGHLAVRLGRRDEARRHFRNGLALLERRAADEVLPEADGMTAGRMAELVRFAAGHDEPEAAHGRTLL